MRAAGYKNSAIERVRQARVLRTIERGMYLHASAPPSWEQRLRACIVAGGDRTFATAQSALVKHEVLPATEEVVLVVPYQNRLHVRGGTVIRSRRPLTGTRILDDIPVVSVERALLDAAGLMTPVELECAIEAALLKNKTTETRLWRTLVEQGGRGVAGSAAFRRVLELRPNGRPARSVLEVFAGHLLRRGAITGFVRNHQVRVGATTYELDVAFLNRRVVLEVDGRAFHSTATQVGRDKARQKALEAAGWRFLRVSWWDVICEPDRVLRDLRALLDAEL